MSEKPKWTPGPWYPGHLGEDGRCQCTGIVDETFAGGIATVHVDNGIVMIDEGGNDCPPKDQAIGNMHLISAAPELYEALAHVVQNAALNDADLQIARRALAKARGEDGT